MPQGTRITPLRARERAGGHRLRPGLQRQGIIGTGQRGIDLKTVLREANPATHGRIGRLVGEPDEALPDLEGSQS